MTRQVVFVINNEDYPINMDSNLRCKMPERVINIFWECKKYEVQSTVTKEIFQTFLDYISGKVNELPINSHNIYYYYQLCNEFEKSFDFASNSQYEQMLQLSILEHFDSSTNQDKSSCEKNISKNFGVFITNYSKEMYKIPISSLFNIFNDIERSTQNEDDAYNFIVNSKNTEFYILFSCLDGEKLNSANFEDSIKKKDEHFGFIPKFSFLLNELNSNSKYIKKLENENLKMKFLMRNIGLTDKKHKYIDLNHNKYEEKEDEKEPLI